jgi:hypothetical protein
MRLELELEGGEFVPGEAIHGRAKIHLSEPFRGSIRVVPVWEIGPHIHEKPIYWGGSLLVEGTLKPGYYEYVFQGVAPPGPFTTNGRYIDIKTRIRLEVVQGQEQIAYTDRDFQLSPGPVDGQPRHYALEGLLELETRANTPAPDLRLDIPECFPPEIPSKFRVNFRPERTQEINHAGVIFEGFERFALPRAPRTPLEFQLHHGFQHVVPLDFGGTTLEERVRYEHVTTFTPPPVCSFHGKYNQILWRARVLIAGPLWTVNEIFPIIVHPRMRPEVQL